MFRPPLRRKILRLIGGFLLASCTLLHAEFAQLGPVTTLDNGAVSLDVALRVGRIVSFNRPGEANWLVVHDEVPHPGWNWNPWGGDRMWPTSQTLNYQIYRNNGFDPVIDGQPWELVSKTATTLEMRSGISPELGLQVTHHIELVGKTAEVVHTYRVKRVSKSKFPVHVWTVTGIRACDYMLMESDARVKHEGYKPYRTWAGTDFTAPPAAALLPGTRTVQVFPPKDSSMKIGAYGRWIASVNGGSVFWQSVRYLPDELYLDACNLEAFMNTKTETYELEALSPTWFLAKGESREWSVRWRLLDFPAEAKTTPAKADFLQAQLEAPAK
ncbi:MAG: hypothetical protein ACAH89_01870 [Rariglobus sp.]